MSFAWSAALTLLFCWGAQILLTSAMKVKIADFGLAKYQQITSTTGVGTPAYMVSELSRT